ncbi:MAG: hypothetical protein IKY27_00275 [Bacteroidales bacterium]|nr:hypothetical protein [Bacteroidales bacterium]
MNYTNILDYPEKIAAALLRANANVMHNVVTRHVHITSRNKKSPLKFFEKLRIKRFLKKKLIGVVVTID